MGQTGTKYLLPHLWKEDEPYCWDDIKYDPEFGFKNPRKEKGKSDKLDVETLVL